MSRILRHLTYREPPVTVDLVAHVRSASSPLNLPADLDPLLDRIGDARYVLLGEASHGTHEYYVWREAISRRLIAERGFSFIAVEGDWPDCYRVNRYIKNYPEAGASAREVLHAFERWPTWMWANEEVVDLAEWLRRHNAHLAEQDRIGFYGLDVYSLWDSLHQVLSYLSQSGSPALPAARRAFQCFERYGEDVHDYAAATRWADASCENEVVALLADVRRRMASPENDGRESLFNAEQNALVVKNAELYYRTMVQGGPESWNIRDLHMTETLERLMDVHGPQAKAIVWAHNTHVGDARFTDMVDDGMINIGQLARERHAAEGVVLVGFGSWRGSVIAGQQWDAPMEPMDVPPARYGSWDHVLHQAGGGDRLLLLGGLQASAEFLVERGQRAIGVVYHPGAEHLGNYVPTVLPRRYDALLFVDETRALHPLHLPAMVSEGEFPETFPSGL